MSETRSDCWNCRLRDRPHLLRRQRRVADAATSPSRCRSAAGTSAAPPSPAPAGRPAASCTAAPARRYAVPVALRSGTRPAAPGRAAAPGSSGCVSTALAQQPRALRRRRTSGRRRSARRGGRTASAVCSRRPREELVAASRTGSVELARATRPRQSSSAVRRSPAAAGSGRTGGGGRRPRRGAGCSAGSGSRPAQAQAEVGLAAGRRPAGAAAPRPATASAFHGIGLVVQGQAGLLVAVVQGLRLRAEPVQRPAGHVIAQSRQRLIQGHIEVLRRRRASAASPADQAVGRAGDAEPVRAKRLVEHARHPLQRQQQAS